MTGRTHLTQIFEIEDTFFAAANGRLYVVRGNARLPDSVLRRRRTVARASGKRYERAVA
jgi:hypothetical protein